MFFKEWVVLLVDDEPDVLSISKLAMRNFEVYGLPLKLYTAESKTEAVQLLHDSLEVASSLAVAFIDVVMETDTAGFELCEYIRDGMGNRLSQLFIRTGQPGIAPERAVIDQYDINGYFTKIEATEDKLYSLVKSSVRQYLAFGMSQATLGILNELIAASGSREDILEVVRPMGGFNRELSDIPRWLIIDDQVLFADEVDAGSAMKLRDQLGARGGIALNPEGDTYVKGEEDFQLIHVVKKPSQADATHVFQSRFTPPEHVVHCMHSAVTGLATAWQQAH